MSGTFNDRGELDISAAPIIAILGKKGSGKSVLADTFGASWPYDMVVIDVAGDDGPEPRPRPGTGSHDVFDITGSVDELPTSWPEHLRRGDRPMILHYVPDSGSATELEDMDAMAGLAYKHSSRERPAMLIIHEIGRAAPAGRTPAHMRRVYNHGRHRGLAVVTAGPRTMTTEPLVIAQADLVYVFELNQPADRRRIAENIGWDPGAFDQAVHDLGRYGFLRFDAREPKPEQPDDEDYRLVEFPPLPDDVVAAALAWAHPPTASGPVS